MYRGKNVEQNCWAIGFSSFLDFDKKNLCFCSKVFGRVVQNTFDVSSGTLTEQIFRMEVLETRGFSKNFWSFRDNGGKVLQTWQNSNRCQREQFMKNFFQKRKIRSFFPILCDCLLPAKFFARVAKPEIYVSVGVFEKNNFWNIYIYNLSHFFRTLIQKTLSRKENFFPGLSQLQSARPETFSEKKYFLQKKVLFVHLFWSLSNFSCLLTKNSQGVKETTN